MRQKLKQLFQIQQIVKQSGYPDYIRISNEIYEFCDGDDLQITKVLERIKSDEPWEYIRGYTEFYGYEFTVNSSTLIPRIETEQLIDIACSLVMDRNIQNVMDVGTGSGNIVISLCKTLKEKYPEKKIKYTATDINKDALEIAKSNSERNGVEDMINFVQTDLVDGVNIEENTLVIANLPYIPTDIYKNLCPSVINFEPRTALDGGIDGIKYYKELITTLSKKYPKTKNITLLIEIDPSITKQLHTFYQGEIHVIKDQNNLDRFALIYLT